MKKFGVKVVHEEWKRDVEDYLDDYDSRLLKLEEMLPRVDVSETITGGAGSDCIPGVDVTKLQDKLRRIRHTLVDFSSNGYIPSLYIRDILDEP